MKKKRSELAQDSETKIRMAAEKVFAEKGLKGARVKDIAELCGVNPALINYYFGSKENLYFTVIENFFMRVERLSLSIMAQDIAPKEKLYKLIESGIDELAQQDHISRILMREFVDVSNESELITKRNLRRIFSSANQLMSPAGANKDEESQLQTMHFIFSVLGCMTLYFISGPIIKDIWKKDIFTKKMIEDRKKEVISLIFEGVKDRFD